MAKYKGKAPKETVPINAEKNNGYLAIIST
jgi:hypothetical protein